MEKKWGSREYRCICSYFIDVLGLLEELHKLFVCSVLGMLHCGAAATRWMLGPHSANWKASPSFTSSASLYWTSYASSTVLDTGDAQVSKSESLPVRDRPKTSKVIELCIQDNRRTKKKNMTTLDFMEAVLNGTSIWAASWGMTYELGWSEDSLAGNWFQDLCKLCFSGKTVTINSNLKKLKLKKKTLVNLQLLKIIINRIHVVKLFRARFKGI